MSTPIVHRCRPSWSLRSVAASIAPEPELPAAVKMTSTSSSVYSQSASARRPVDVLVPDQAVLVLGAINVDTTSISGTANLAPCSNPARNSSMRGLALAPM